MMDCPSHSPSPAAGYDTAQVDASCLAPLFVLFSGAALWLVLASLCSLIASIKFHSPDFLAGCAWLTYGRVRAVATDAQTYGFAMQAALGAALWIIARLVGNRVAQPGLIAFGGILWNLGVLVGVTGILAGDGTGFENFEMPRYAALLLFLAYLVIALWTVLTLRGRRQAGLDPSQWFLLAALFWFPWIHSTATLLLTVCPVRGVMQSVVAWWYSANLNGVWFGLTGLAILFYLLPRLTDRTLHSRHLALFAFWTLILFGSWSGIPAGAPVPAWMPALSAVATVLTIVPALAVAVNVFQTTGCPCCRTKGIPPGSFLAVGTVSFVLGGFLRAAGAVPQISAVTRFTWFTVAQSQLAAYGFVGMTLFGAVYHIVPQVAGMEWPCRRSVRAHFWLATGGILLCVAPLAIGGVLQGLKLNNDQVVFMDVTQSTLLFLRISTLGELALVIGNLLLAVNLVRLAARYSRTHFAPAWKSAMAELEPAEVKP